MHGWRVRLRNRIDAVFLTAVCRNDVARARRLLWLGANPDMAGWCDLGLASALSAACIHGNLPLIRLLLENGANPDGSAFESVTPRERLTDGIGDGLSEIGWEAVAVRMLDAVRGRCDGADRGEHS